MVRIITALIGIFCVTAAEAQETTTVVTPATDQETTTVVTPATPPPQKTVIVNPMPSKEIIVTEVPAPKEEIVAPTGYIDCFVVEAGWMKNEWIPRHRICEYENMPGKAAWVEGYWACETYKLDEGICTDWKWRPAHWVEKLVIY